MKERMCRWSRNKREPKFPKIQRYELGSESLGRQSVRITQSSLLYTNNTSSYINITVLRLERNELLILL